MCTQYMCREETPARLICGDILNDFDKGEFTVLLHVTNCQHVMGAGFAKQLVNIYPEVMEADLTTSKGSSKLGDISVAKVINHYGDDAYIVNMYAQDKYGRDKQHIDMDALASCLMKVAKTYTTKIAMPKIGSGLAGGDWTKIAKVIETYLDDYKVYIYLNIVTVNMSKYKNNVVVCDRTSKLGNYSGTVKKHGREKAIRAHRDKLWSQLWTKPDRNIIDAVKKIYIDGTTPGKQVPVGCWCAPKDCHTKNIIDACMLKANARIIVAGSRSYKNHKHVYSELNRILRYFDNVEIVSGDAVGPDKYAIQYAKDNNIRLKIFRAKWDDIEGKPKAQINNINGRKYWVKAGYHRNTVMAEYSNILIAFNAGSNGTKHMIKHARTNGMLVFDIDCREE